MDYNPPIGAIVEDSVRTGPNGEAYRGKVTQIYSNPSTGNDDTIVYENKVETEGIMFGTFNAPRSVLTLIAPPQVGLNDEVWHLMLPLDSPAGFRPLIQGKVTAVSGESPPLRMRVEFTGQFPGGYPRMVRWFDASELFTSPNVPFADPDPQP